jgi:hypothetical protein
MAPVVEDERIQAALTVWKQSKSALRRDVARFLAEFGENG